MEMQFKYPKYIEANLRQSRATTSPVWKVESQYVNNKQNNKNITLSDARPCLPNFISLTRQMLI